MKHSITLLRAYAMQRGLFARVAKRLGLDPSYVSRVAHGERHSRKITIAIESELKKMLVAILGKGKPSRHNAATVSAK
jgi:hypothetical protein